MFARHDLSAYERLERRLDAIISINLSNVNNLHDVRIEMLALIVGQDATIRESANVYTEILATRLELMAKKLREHPPLPGDVIGS